MRKEVDILNELKGKILPVYSMTISEKEMSQVLFRKSKSSNLALMNYSVFSCPRSINPGLVKLTKKENIFPLYMEYYQTRAYSNITSWKKKIHIPVRSTQCQHADVFDFEDFIETWKKGNSFCPICREKISVSSLYIDTRVYSALQADKEAVFAAIPKRGAEGYDPEIVQHFSEKSIENMRSYGPVMTMMLPRKKTDEKAMLSNYSPAFVLEPITYKQNKLKAQIQLRYCAQGKLPDVNRPAFLLNVMFMSPKQMRDLVKEIFTTQGSHVESDSAVFIDLFYFLKSSGHKDDLLIARNIFMLMVGFSLSHAIVIHLCDEFETVLKEYLHTLNDLYHPSSFPPFYILYQGEKSEEEIKNDLQIDEIFNSSIKLSVIKQKDSSKEIGRIKKENMKNLEEEEKTSIQIEERIAAKLNQALPMLREFILLEGREVEPFKVFTYFFDMFID